MLTLPVTNPETPRPLPDGPVEVGAHSRPDTIFVGLWRIVVLRRAMLATVAASFAIFALMALQSVLAARLLGPTGRGEYSAVILYSQMLLYVGLCGAPLTLARRASADGSSGQLLRNAAMRFGLSTGCITAVVVAVLGCLALPADKRYLAPFCALAALMLPGEHARLALLAVEHGRGSFRRYNYFRLAAAVAFPLFLACCWLLGQESLLLVLTGTIVAPLLGLGVYLLCEPRTRPWDPLAVAPRELAREGWPYAAENLVGHVYSKLDLLTMLWLASDLTVQGHYAAAIPAANLLAVAPNALELFSFNAGARAASKPTGKRLFWLGIGLASMQILSAAVLYFTIEPLVMLVYGEKFRSAVPFAKALLPALAISGCCMVAESYLRGRGRPGISMRASMAAAAALLVAVGLLFPTYREMSIPIAMGISRVVALLWLSVAVFVDRPSEQSPHAAAQGGNDV